MDQKLQLKKVTNIKAFIFDLKEVRVEADQQQISLEFVPDYMVHIMKLKHCFSTFWILGT